jgi:hypothetical protein
MPILCLEGPSAVGKTTTAAALQGAYVVPEVNLLFVRPAEAGAGWYLERQVDRWAIAAWRSAHHPLCVLDGDPLQPLWYNWIHGFERWEDLDALEAFFRPRLMRGELAFPELYVVLGTSAEQLRRRQEGDAARRRRGFDAHLRLVEPQRRYFQAMNGFAPGLVRFVDAEDADETVRSVAAAARDARAVDRPVALFDQMVRWLRDNRPE